MTIFYEDIAEKIIYEEEGAFYSEKLNKLSEWREVDRLLEDIERLKNQKSNDRWCDNMIYPQSEYRYEKYISKSDWEYIQEKAKISLDKTKQKELENIGKKKNWFEEFCNEGAIEVNKHMQNIIDGILPFGYKILEDSFDEDLEHNMYRAYLYDKKNGNTDLDKRLKSKIEDLEDYSDSGKECYSIKFKDLDDNFWFSSELALYDFVSKQISERFYDKELRKGYFDYINEENETLRYHVTVSRGTFTLIKDECLGAIEK